MNQQSRSSDLLYNNKRGNNTYVPITRITPTLSAPNYSRSNKGPSIDSTSRTHASVGWRSWWIVPLNIDNSDCCGNKQLTLESQIGSDRTHRMNNKSKSSGIQWNQPAVHMECTNKNTQIRVRIVWITKCRKLLLPTTVQNNILGLIRDERFAKARTNENARTEIIPVF